MSHNQDIFTNKKGISLSIKREDLLHPYISGNKFRKLKYNIEFAKNNDFDTIVTFGGAFSNHIVAVAAAGFENNIKTIGIIRGEELQNKYLENPSLKKASEFGMKFEFLTREFYQNKNEEQVTDYLHEKYGQFYLIPEGGTNELAIKGCEEILVDDDFTFDFITCSVGTGGTVSGLINCSKRCQKVLGFSALKGDFLGNDIRKFVKNDNWELITTYHFGGYAKVSLELIEFCNYFYNKYSIPLDPIYTGKMVFGVFDMIEKNYFPDNSKILMIHTGGLQGIEGMNNKLKLKGLNTLHYI